MSSNPLDPRRTPRNAVARDRYSVTAMVPLERAGALVDRFMTACHQHVTDARLRAKRTLAR